MPLDPHAIHIFVDGSCYKNPGGQGGAAALVEFPEHLNCREKQIVDFGCDETSNNRMELLACIRAFQWIKANKPWPGVTRIQIVSDSRYVIDNLPRAIGWKKSGWRNLHGEPKQNSDLLGRLLSLRAGAGVRVDFEWQRGKKSLMSRSVDKAAKVAAQRGDFKKDTGFRAGKISRSKIKGSANIFPARGQIAVIRPYRKDAPIKNENRIRFDVLESDGTYSGSWYAYADDLIATDLHRQHIYRVRFGANLRNPRIEKIINEVTSNASRS